MITLASITWDIDPEIFRIGPVAVRYYGLLWALSFIGGYYIFERFVKREKLPEGFLDSLTIYTAIGTILGARLGHCLFYEPEYYLSNPIEILKIWRGGLASHGAAVGIIVAIYLFAKKHKKPMLYVLDRIVIPVALAGVLIRLGNLMNSEIYGIETTLPWGFIFERNGEVVAKHPTQLYEALAYLVTYGILHLTYIRKKGLVPNGLLFGLFLIFVFSARFVIEFIKENQVDFESGMALNMGQWLSIPFVLVGVAFVFMALTKNKAKS